MLVFCALVYKSNIMIVGSMMHLGSCATIRPCHGCHGAMSRLSLARTQVNECKGGPRYEKATLLSRVQMQLAELEREMASTKAEVLGSCVTSCSWVSTASAWYLSSAFCLRCLSEVQHLPFSNKVQNSIASKSILTS